MTIDLPSGGAAAPVSRWVSYYLARSRLPAALPATSSTCLQPRPGTWVLSCRQNTTGIFRYLLLRRWRRPIAWYINLEQLFGAQDFIAEDPAVSIDNLLAHKHRYPALARIYDQAKEADLLVLDGDGDIIFSTPPRRQTLFLLAMIELGIRLKKPVFLVNSMISGLSLDRKK